MNKTEFKKSDIELIIVNYLTGSITDEDLVKLTKFINTSTKNRTYFNELKNSWIIAGEKIINSSIHTERSWHTFKHRATQNSSRSGLGFKALSKVKFTNYLKLAASWLIVFGLGSGITWLIFTSLKEKTAISNKTIEISTPLGARSIIKLPDETQVWLNAGTTLTYSQDYGQNTRTLNLNGEAYFDVAKDSQHPFIVKTQGIVVRALGTRFNIKAYPEERTISATLEEGRIDVRILNLIDKNERILLKPHDILIYHKETKQLEKYVESAEDKVKPENGKEVNLKHIDILSNIRTELYTSWKDLRWIIYSEPLSTLAPMLERRFNLKIIFDDDILKNYKFTGIIENETVDQIMTAIKLTAPINYQIRKDTLRLTLDINTSEEFRKLLTRKN
jgi:transmembrane sensor